MTRFAFWEVQLEAIISAKKPPQKNLITLNKQQPISRDVNEFSSYRFNVICRYL